jgi:hypothetical protein
MADADDAVARLYGLPPDQFTSARDQLADELRDQGDRDATAAVKKLRRPTVSAWAVNQLVRNHRTEMQELLSVGEEVRAAQRAALSGGGAETIRELTTRRRRVVDRLLDLSENLLAQAGLGTGRPTLDKVADTLMAVIVDEGAAEAVRAGRLEREITPPSGFDTLAGEVPLSKAPSKPERQARERARQAKERARDAQDAADEADREARHLEQQAERLQKEAERARRRAGRAAERARELAQKAEDSTR